MEMGHGGKRRLFCIKRCLTTKPILGYPDFSRKFIIYTDALGYCIDTVLAQIQTQALPDQSEANEADSAETGDRKVVIAYTSKHLNEREAKWSTTEKECFLIVHAIGVFRPYLYGRSFTDRRAVFTDNRPFEWLMSKPEPAGRLQWWALKIQEYDMKIGYRPGKSHQNADCLSRNTKNLGAIPNNLTGDKVIAAVTFTPRKESQKATGSIHVKTPETNISEWGKLCNGKSDFPDSFMIFILLFYSCFTLMPFSYFSTMTLFYSVFTILPFNTRWRIKTQCLNHPPIFPIYMLFI
jgi:hypothetical protein